jgi:hypothetical protein
VWFVLIKAFLLGLLGWVTCLDIHVAWIVPCILAGNAAIWLISGLVAAAGPDMVADLAFNQVAWIVGWSFRMVKSIICRVVAAAGSFVVSCFWFVFGVPSRMARKSLSALGRVMASAFNLLFHRAKPVVVPREKTPAAAMPLPAASAAVEPSVDQPELEVEPTE